MKLTPKIFRAVEDAAKLHKDQLRKVPPDAPYISHLAAVALIVSQYTDDEDTICAALLHDVLEDVAGHSVDDLTSKFGERTIGIVKEVTEDVDLNAPRDEEKFWCEIKKGYVEGLRTATQEALLVSAADKYHNTISLLIAEKSGELPAERRKSGWIGRLLDHHYEVLEVLKVRLQSPIVGELELILKKADRLRN